MASRVKGITIQIGGDTTGLDKALQGVNRQIRDTQKELKDVERLLKMDPGNTELLAQKEKLLAGAVEETKEKLRQLQEADRQAKAQLDNLKTSFHRIDELYKAGGASKSDWDAPPSS